MRIDTLKLFTSLSLRVAALAALTVGSFAIAGTISGTVTNKTNGKPSVGDKVTLLSLSAGLEELSNAKTDGQGHFALKTPADAPYLIKVEHQKGAYFKNMAPGTTQADITVYDVGTKIAGVSTEADVLRLEASNGQLKVTENYFVKNVSSPPRTESSEHTYEVVLPQDAVLEAAATVGPSNMPLAATPDPVNPKGHYAFSFPIRPNEGESGTRFQLSYHIPYSGSYKFTPKLMEDSDNVAIMVPKTMTFAPGAGTSYQTVPDNTVDGQTFLIRGAKVGQPLEFTVSGTGTWPRDTQSGGPNAAGTSPAAGSAGPNTGDAAAAQGGPNGTPGGGLGNPIDTEDPLSKYKWWILGALALVLVAAAGFLLRKPAGEGVLVPAPAARIDGPVGVAVPVSAASIAASVPAPVSPVSAIPSASKSQLLLEALKEELFAIESEKIAGRISPEEYAQVKAALETVLRRALGRG
jgi:hypothetical protein